MQTSCSLNDLGNIAANNKPRSSWHRSREVRFQLRAQEAPGQARIESRALQ